jgi:hypothetical protein
MLNNDPTAPWNDQMYKNDPMAPHNDPYYKNDPSKPWNSPCGQVGDLNRQEKDYYHRY